MRIATILAAVALAATLPVAAEAMPLAQPIPLAGNDAPAITLTAGGCGPGFHRGFYGVCRPNFYGGGYAVGFRPYGYGRHRGWGWHRGWHRW